MKESKNLLRHHPVHHHESITVVCGGLFISQPKGLHHTFYRDDVLLCDDMHNFERDIFFPVRESYLIHIDLCLGARLLQAPDIEKEVFTP